MNRRRPFATDAPRALQSGLPQLPLAVGLVVLDVWLEVRTGYLLAGSGEEAMSYGIGGVLSAAVGLLVTMLVAVGARLVLSGPSPDAGEARPPATPPRPAAAATGAMT